MSGLGITLYTDEDVDPDLAAQLSVRGYDAKSCHAAGNAGRGLSDEWQLRFATSEGRAMLVFNIADFVAADAAWRARGDEHCGIIFAEAQWPIGTLVRRAICHLDGRGPQDQHNTLLYLATCPD